LFGGFFTISVFRFAGHEKGENPRKAFRAASRNLRLRSAEHEAGFYSLYSNQLFKREDIQQQFGANFNKINL
jgi:hypothetical protein